MPAALDALRARLAELADLSMLNHLAFWDQRTMMPPEAGGMLSRPLVYTALTRAQLHLSIVHASGAALARAVREVDVRPRRTRLAQLLRDDAD